MYLTIKRKLRMKNENMKIPIIVFNGVVLLLIIVLGIQQNVLSQWTYLLLSTLLGVTFAVLIWQPKQQAQYAYFLVIMSALTLWSIHAIATNFTIIPFYDSASEFMFSRALEEEGHFMLNMPWPSYYPSPKLSSSYPLFSLLAVTLKLIIGVDLLHVAIFVPYVNGLASLLFVVLFVKSLSDSAPTKEMVFLLALLFLAVSPDMIYHSMHFYHRDYSLVLCFMTLYFLLKTYSSKPR